MVHRICAVLWLFAGLALSAVPPAGAATIGGSTSQFCNISFAGPIVTGDAERLKAALSSVPPRKLRLPNASGGADDYERTDICLDSPGGSLEETLAIVELLVGEAGNWETAGTVIDNGAACMAECAFIFMAGKYHEFHGISFPLRQLHIGGRLGFKLPSPAGGTSNVDAKALARNFADGVKHVRQLMEQNAKVDLIERSKPFPKTLSAKILTLDEGETLSIETVEQIGLWDIQLLGLPKTSGLGGRLTEAMLHRACVHYSQWWHGARPAGAAAAADAVVEFKGRNYYRANFKGFGSKGKSHCVVYFFNTKANGPKLDISIYESLTPKKDEYRSTPKELDEHLNGADEMGKLGQAPWYLADPKTKISELAAFLQ